MERALTELCRKCGREIAAASELCMYCGAYKLKTDKPHHRVLFLVVGCTVSVVLFLTLLVVGEPDWLRVGDSPPYFLSSIAMIFGILTTFALAYELFGGGNSWDGDDIWRSRWANDSGKRLKIDAPTFDDQQKLMCDAHGRKIPFSAITIQVETVPVGCGGEQELLRPPIHRVYAVAGKNYFALESFTKIKEAKEYARQMKEKVATGSANSSTAD